MASILQKQAALVEEFAALGDDWQARYARIIARAKQLAPMADALKTDVSKVRGCSSAVWLTASFADGKVHYQADSDAILVKGLVELLLSVYSGHTPREIASADPVFIEELGLNVNLSPNRANGLTAMVVQLKQLAQGFAVAAKAVKPPLT